MSIREGWATCPERVRVADESKGDAEVSNVHRRVGARRARLVFEASEE